MDVGDGKQIENTSNLASDNDIRGGPFLNSSPSYESRKQRKRSPGFSLGLCVDRLCLGEPICGYIIFLISGVPVVAALCGCHLSLPLASAPRRNAAP